MSLYVGIADNYAKEVSSLYIGVNDEPREVTELYQDDDEVKLAYSGKPEPGQTVFTSSGNFTVPNGVKEIECFLVGGGGSGADLAGGGGGYTKTEKLKVSPGQSISVVIGSEGKEYSSSGMNTIGKPGGSTTIDIDSISSYGGMGGRGFSTKGSSGGDGGSGGGANGAGGTDGSNGKVGNSSISSYIGGIGQHTTTRAFGEIKWNLIFRWWKWCRAHEAQTIIA